MKHIIDPKSCKKVVTRQPIKPLILGKFQIDKGSKYRKVDLVGDTKEIV